MSHISVLRQRIKTIQTIRKTTSAMRLATRAIQARLKNKKAIFDTYVKAFKAVHRQYEQLHGILTPIESTTSTHLVVLIGSQKGLCGVFNERLFAFFRHNAPKLPPYRIITVGTQAFNFIKSRETSPQTAFNNFSSITLISIGQELLKLCIAASPLTLTIISNKQRSFFLQQPSLETITIPHLSFPDDMNTLLSRLKLQNFILELLYDSLIAEQSARFLSMDSATRNAEDVLNQTKIDYNKLRQALVTRELLELSSSL